MSINLKLNSLQQNLTNLHNSFVVFTLIGVLLDGVVCYLGKDLELYSEEETTEPPPKKIEPSVQKETKADSDNEEGPLKYSYLSKSP